MGLEKEGPDGRGGVGLVKEGPVGKEGPEKEGPVGKEGPEKEGPVGKEGVGPEGPVVDPPTDDTKKVCWQPKLFNKQPSASTEKRPLGLPHTLQS
jgi:hypothetical protein